MVIPFLVRCAGEKRAKHLLLTGDLLSAESAVNIGLFDECVPDNQCLSRAIELAGKLGGYPSAAYKHTKRLLNESLQTSRLESSSKTVEANLEFYIDSSCDFDKSS